MGGRVPQELEGAWHGFLRDCEVQRVLGFYAYVAELSESGDADAGGGSSPRAVSWIIERARLGPAILQVMPALQGQSFYEIRHCWTLGDLTAFLRGLNMKSEIQAYYAKQNG